MGGLGRTVWGLGGLVMGLGVVSFGVWFWGLGGTGEVRGLTKVGGERGMGRAKSACGEG